MIYLKKYKLLLWILFAGIFISNFGCKKYPDGPLLSIHSKKHRIMGTWDVEYFAVNGYDSTSYLKGQPLYGMYSFGKMDLWGNPGAAAYLSDTHFLSGQWRFEEQKESISIEFFSYLTNDHSTIGPYRAENVSWKIRRLAEKELWLETTYMGKEYFLKFKLYKNY